ncbi:MAG: acyl-CoA dehydrogenase [Pseudomonadota bacterium]
MDFAFTDEQRMLQDTVRQFVANEMTPHEELVERTSEVPKALAQEITGKALELGLYACNMPEELGGGGLDILETTLVEYELGRTAMALAECCWRPSNILQAANPAQMERYTLPTIRGEKRDCIAMTEPDAGSDLRGMKAKAEKDGDDWIINGTKHFISNAQLADYIILFVATGEEVTPRGPKKRITSFLVDCDAPGVTVRDGYNSVSHKGYHNAIIDLQNVRVGPDAVLGAEGTGFDVVNQWLGATRLQVAAVSAARSQRALDVALDWSVNRKQFGQQICKFQGVSFQLADMEVDCRLSRLILFETAWKMANGQEGDADAAVAKLFCSEALSRVADKAIQIAGGMGLMSDMPLERIWRDARIERIWDGTSEIQRHIISRAMLRPLGG